jgi:hypothetical protein
MSNDKSISVVNFGELSKPADTLIKKVSSAVGGVFEPWQIKRVAKAEAEASLIKAESEIQITELHRRAMHRFVEEEANRQENMETITAKAIPQLGNSSDPSKMEDDWVTNFFDKSRIVSDSEMQDLWSQVLAGEANSPGSFSKRTVNFLGSLDKADARLFSTLCGFGWFLGDVIPLIYNEEDSIYNVVGINFSSLQHLDDIGLVSFNNTGGFMRVGFLKQAQILYYGQSITIEFPNNEKNELNLGKILLSQTGQQLAKICGSKPVDGFMEYVLKEWANKNIIASSPFPKAK